MRHGQALLVGLLAGLLSGCAGGESLRPSSWLEHFRSAQRLPESNFIQFDVAMLERPLGDPYLDRGLWDSADEEIVPLERKPALEENGFRVGDLGTLAPAPFQALLTNERTCLNPRRLFLRPGNTTWIALGPAIPSCTFRMQQGDHPQLLSLEQAECAFSVVPSLTEDGRTHLRITPEVRYGEKVRAPRAAEDGSGFQFQEQRPTKTYPTLAWEVTLAPNQYLVVGTRSELSNALGYQCFSHGSRKMPVQRVLVIRCCHSASDALPEVAAQLAEDDSLNGRPLPLALQAAGTAPYQGRP